MIDRIIRHRNALMVGLALTLGVLGYGLTHLRLEFSFDSFFPKEDPAFAYFAAYEEQFTEAQDFLIAIAFQNEAGNIFDQDFLRTSDSIYQKLAALPGIDSSAIATQVGKVKRTGLGFSFRPYLDFSTPEKLRKSQRSLRNDSLFSGAFMSHDSSWVCSYIFIEENIFDKKERDGVSREIDKILEDVSFPKKISGIPYIRTNYVDKLSKELMIFLSLAAFLLTACLTFLYRTFWGVAGPLLIAVGALVGTLGFMGLTGEPITILSNLLIPVMFVVAMSDVIHVITKYLGNTAAGHDRKESLRRTLSMVGMATFLTSLTTAIGFGALMVSPIRPMRMFGIYAAVGVLFTFVITVIALTYLLPRLDPAKIAKPGKGFAASGIWEHWLGKLDTWIGGHQRGIVWGSVGIMGLALWFTLHIPFNNFLLQDLNDNDPVKQSMQFFEQEFSGGIRTFEMGFHTQEGHTIDDLQVLKEIEKIEHFLYKTGSFSTFFSPITLLKGANQVYHFDRPSYYALPDSQSDVDTYLKGLQIQGGSTLLNMTMNDDRTWGRLSARMPDIGTEAFYALTAKLDSFATQSVDSTLVTYKITGHSALTEQNLIYLRESLLEGLMIAFILVGFIMGLLFRSWRMLLVSLVPNFAPLLLTGGVMGLFGITLSSSTAIVFVVAFGIAVDDTIHFLTRFKLERDGGASVEEAIRTTMLGTGKAMILTSIVLLGGFVILLASNFGGTFNTGFFTALTILFALLSDLILLPVLLRWVFREK